MEEIDLSGFKLSTMASGRIAIKVPDHPKANGSGYVLRARYIMEQKLGRHLLTNEEVHHKNHDKTDDREENLEVLSKSEHAKIHLRPQERVLDYDLIVNLKLQGLGAKKIVKSTGYKLPSVKSAIKVLRKENRI